LSFRTPRIIPSETLTAGVTEGTTRRSAMGADPKQSEDAGSSELVNDVLRIARMKRIDAQETR